VFLIFLDVVEEPSATALAKPKFTQSIKDALCVPLQDIRQAANPAIADRFYAPRPGLFRIMVMDEGLTLPLDLVTLCITLSDYHGVYDQNWLASLNRNSVSSSK
jgi:hypothetical protein